uniref:polyubiquitin-like n=1 Tax=Erigeron canadensis TaxID=72917 RepID=UPI001CB9592C|nr:polyubiquitin-like [Erigeron canadensis]
MKIMVLRVLKESPLRLKVEHKRSTLMSKQILMKAKSGQREYAMTVGKLLRYGIQEKYGPSIVIKSREGSQKFARRVTWKYIPVKVDRLHTIGDVKMHIEETEGIPVYRQRIVFKGKCLGDEGSLADYDIQDSCVLHLVDLL